jgi:hypothetical protein
LANDAPASPAENGCEELFKFRLSIFALNRHANRSITAKVIIMAMVINMSMVKQCQDRCQHPISCPNNSFKLLRGISPISVEKSPWVAAGLPS